MTKFQFITLAVFVVCLIAGVATFALYKGKSASTALPTITIWGTFPATTFNQYVNTLNNTLAQPVAVDYVQQSEDQFSQNFVAALARGTGPDAILIPADDILPQEDKLALIPFTALPQRTFINSYVDEAQMYIAPNGILALPFTLDPLVMYWNRDMFNAAGVATPPQFWDQFAALSAKMTVKDQNGNIRKSAVALGEFGNIDNAREIFGTLLLQLGNPVTTQNADGTVSSALSDTAAVSPAPALTFFAQFVDPNNAAYSWNKGLPDSKSSFLSGILATYFGFASELSDIRAKNPNLNFDVAPIPQLRVRPVVNGNPVPPAAYGRMYGFSIVHSSPNANADFQVMSILTAPANLAMLSQTMYLPPVSRPLIAQGSSDPYISVFDQAALVTKAWPDVGTAQSTQIFGNMVEAFTSGQKTALEAIQDAGNEYDAALTQGTQ